MSYRYTLYLDLYLLESRPNLKIHYIYPKKYQCMKKVDDFFFFKDDHGAEVNALSMQGKFFNI